MANGLIYRQPQEMSREELEAEFASNDPERIMNALIAAFYTEPPDVLEAWCHRFAAHPGADARRGAAIVLGNTAAVYGLRDFERAVSVLEELRQDPAVKMHAEDSLDDVLHSGNRRKQTQ
jgi:hypothetical protein